MVVRSAVRIGVAGMTLWAAALAGAAEGVGQAGRGDAVMRELEARVKRDDQDFVALNKLGELYLARLRKTGDITYAGLALKAAKMSVAAVGIDMNAAGVALRGRAEHASHEFKAELRTADEILKLRPDHPDGLCLQGDALMELGDYAGAAAAYGAMLPEGDGGVEVETRLGRLAWIKGDVAGAKDRFGKALAAAETAREGGASPEPVGWCRWQLGEVAFNEGDYAGAEKLQRETLAEVPGYFRAMASLGRALAAQGKLKEAAEQYEAAVRVVPDVVFVAALGDVYAAMGNPEKAGEEYDLVAQIRKLAAAGKLFDRVMAVYLADHDLRPEEAYRLAKDELAQRSDVYGWDALCWTAVKAGKVEEAMRAGEEAVKLGTPDPRIWYHAGMAALAAGKTDLAKARLGKALGMSGEFDVIQAPKARVALAGLK